MISDQIALHPVQLPSLIIAITAIDISQETVRTWQSFSKNTKNRLLLMLELAPQLEYAPLRMSTSPIDQTFK